RMTKALVISALNKAYTIQEPREGLIHHSDQGSQYASIEYQNLLREKEIQSSMSRKGNCYDNACIASFHSIIKKELIYHQNIRTIKPGKKQCLALWRISLLFIILNEYIQR
ncbi:DDE-type integrase/transposase/recombinase, partial [Staphylococcus pseudintermedius]|nr:DDE-type integrase/transposase/recombinase [Staphylococcus pseudintermedius]